MARYRKIFYANGATMTIQDDEVIEVTGEIPGETVKTHTIMPDAPDFVSLIDGSVVSGRAGVREHEKRHGVKQIGNDYSFEQRKRDMNARYSRDENGNCTIPRDHAYSTWE